MTAISRVRRCSDIYGAGFACLCTLSVSMSAQGLNFQWGEVEGQLDSSISIGASWRVQSPDDRLISAAAAGDLPDDFFPGISEYNGPHRDSSNYDDGNLNFDAGDSFSQVIQGRHELSLDWENYGLFIRGRYWYDRILQDKTLPHRDIPKDSVDNIGSGAEILDFLVYGNFYLGDKPLSLRVGRQVISWGESLFIQGGINIINPIDLNTFRSPGAEIKDGLLPTEKIYANLALTDDISLEAFVDLNWKEVRTDPCGTYFNTGDFSGTGCDYAILATGAVTLDDPSPFEAELAAYNAVVSSSTATPEEIQDAFGAALVAFGGDINFFTVTPRTADEKPDDDNLQYGVSLRWFSTELNNTEFGFYYINYHSKLPYFNLDVSIPDRNLVPLGNVVPQFGEQVVAPAAAGYHFVYPEDIELFGLSFSTSIQEGFFAGLALAGEWSYRPNQPVQQSPPVFLLRGLFVDTDPETGELTRPFGDETSFVEHEVHTLQVNGIYLWPDVLGASLLGVAAEVGAVYVPSLEDYPSEFENNGFNPAIFNADGSLRFEQDALGLNVSAQNEVFVDRFSWGYQIRMLAEYNNAFAGVNLVPQISWRHDVKGFSPGPGEAFLEDRQALGISLAANYLEKYSAVLSYTAFFGSKTSPDNQEIQQFHDRDFVSVSFQYTY